MDFIKNTKATKVSGIKLSVPELFARQDFQEWLKNSKAMTWYRPGDDLNEDGYFDVAVFVDPSLSGEGSDDEMPGWDEVVERLKREIGSGPYGGNHFIVLLSNC